MHGEGAASALPRNCTAGFWFCQCNLVFGRRWSDLSLNPFSKNGQRGISLIEVVIALVILSLLIVPLVNMYLQGRFFTAGAWHELAAMSEAQEIIESIKGLPFDQVGQAQGGTDNEIALASDTTANFNSAGNWLIFIASGKGAGQVRKITGYYPSENAVTVSPVWDELPDSTSSYLICKSGTMGIGSVSAASADTIRLDSSESKEDGFYENYFVKIAGGPGAGQVRRIVDYDGDTQTAQVEPAWETPPVKDASYYLLYRYEYTLEFSPSHSSEEIIGAENGMNSSTSTNISLLKTIKVTVYYTEQNRRKEISLATEKLRR